MDTAQPEAIENDLVEAVVAAAWSVDIASLLYVPKGVGSYHWVVDTAGAGKYFGTVDDLDDKPWIGRDRTLVFDGLSAAYATARALYDVAGLKFVVAPLPSSAGEVCVRLSDRYGLTLFPYVVGDPGTWGCPVADGHRHELLGALASLHRVRSGSGQGICRYRHVLPERDALAAALDSLATAWTGGPFGEPTRHLLTEYAVRVRQELARFDELAARLDSVRREPVVTHGEPHPGNIMRTGDGLRLIDWDTVALAEPERDLWMLDTGAHDAFAEYTDATGVEPDADAIAFYRLAWTLSDVATLSGVFRGRHPDSAWAAQKFSGLVGVLEHGSATPYGAS